MKRHLWLAAAVLLSAIMVVQAQDLRSLQPSRYSMQVTHILTRDGNLKTGWFIGTFGDSLVAQIARKSERISRRDLVRVDVERPTERSAGALAGVLMGIYAGNALALRAENQPFLLMREESGGELALYSALFGLVGGVIGTLIGGSASNAAVFNFPTDEAENSAAWKDFVESNSTGPHNGNVHFCMQGSWVTGALPTGNSIGGDYNYYGTYAAAYSLNMVRKLQLTYSINQFLDAGLAFVWLGQPSFSTYGPTYPTDGLYYPTGLTVSLEGTGRYAVGVFQPLWKLGLRGLQWDVGGGVGVASYHFQASSAPYYYSYDSAITRQSIEQKKTVFSTLLYTEMKVFPSDFFSLGIAADWVYIPDRVPFVQNFKFDSDHLGTTSIGFVLTFHI